jgi:macrolide transport system ATP-binding/permease protein
MIQDLRFALRMLLKKPGFALIAVLTLGLGVGANTAIFSLLNTVLLRPLPIASPETVVSLNSGTQGKPFYPAISYADYKEIRDRDRELAGLAAYGITPLGMSYEGRNDRVWGYYVSGNYFSLLGVGAMRGRVITPADDASPGAHAVVMLSYSCWRRRFGGDPQIIGKDLLIAGRNYTIIGVSPEGFRGTEIAFTPEFWLPMMMMPQIDKGLGALDRRESPSVFALARLKPGQTESQGESALNAITAQLGRAYPQTNEGQLIKFSKPGLFGAAMRGPILAFTTVLFGVVGLVLLLACANLANLLLARATERSREIAVRLALGASRARLLRQLLTESIALSLLGGVLGLGIAMIGASMAEKFQPPGDMAMSLSLSIDSRVMLFTAALSLVTGVVFGLLPALQSTRPDLIPALKNETAGSGSNRSRLRSGLVVAQIALSMVLLLCAGLVLRGLQRAQTINPGFNPQHAVEISFDPATQGYDKTRSRELQRLALDRIRQSSGVTAAALTTRVPLTFGQKGGSIFMEGAPSQTQYQAPYALSAGVSTDYFRTMETRLLHGRDFTVHDDVEAPLVAIVNETFARRFLSGGSALGKRFAFSAPPGKLIEIVGVAQDGKYFSLGEKPEPFVWVPLPQTEEGAVTLVARAQIDPSALLPTIRNEMRAIDPNLPLYNAQTMIDHMSLPLFPARVAASVLGAFGALALLLAAIGVFGVMSIMVAQRTREIGVRIALGATAYHILRLVVGNGARLTLLGVVIGLGLAALGTRLLSGMLYGVNALDPLTFAGVTALLSFVAFLACYLPARRATRVDPMTALRQD